MANNYSRRQFLRTGAGLAAAIAFGSLEALAEDKNPETLAAEETRKAIAAATIKRDGKSYLKAGNLQLEIVDPKITGLPKEYVDALNTGVPLVYLTQGALSEQITEHFTLGEFAIIPTPSSNNGINIPVYEFKGVTYHQFIRLDPRLPGKLEQLRTVLNMPININSPYRNVTYNKFCKGEEKSRHKAGQAADLTADSLSKLYSLADKQFQNGGVGYYPKRDFVHVDVRGFKSRWKK